MKFIDEYRDAQTAKYLACAIKKMVTRPHVIMEVCGGQTHSIVKNGIDRLLPEQIELVHGPGCPVCVTSLELIDHAIAMASRSDVIFCSFGDMLRVPGSQKDLFSVKADGGDVRIVYSPMDALHVARQHPDKQVVFFAVGFETTAPANAMSVYQAKKQGIQNYSILVSHVLVPPAIKAILSSSNNRVNGFLAAGHVCAVMGYQQYGAIAEHYHVPLVVCGFEPCDILQGIYMLVKQLEEGRHVVENAYRRCVVEKGNVHAQDLIEQVFEVKTRVWRGIGEITESGLKLKSAYAQYDAERRFGLSDDHVEENKDCISGLVLQGMKKPYECVLFGKQCTPMTPVGATMVSGEGACSAYYKYRK